MAKGSGGTRGAAGGGNSKFANIPGLQGIKDASVRNELIRALEDYDKEFGVRQSNIVLDKLEDFVAGEARTSGGKTVEIALDRATFGKSSKEISKMFSDAEKSGLLSSTKNPIRHILAHELGHATWQPAHFTKGEGYKTKQIKNKVVGAYRKFLNDKSATGWGSYAKSSYGEFFAEAVAKHMYGTKDKHTAAVVKIIKDWNL